MANSAVFQSLRMPPDSARRRTTTSSADEQRVSLVRSSIPTIGLLALAALSLACESPVQVCNLEFVYGLRIVVADSVSGAPLVGPETVVAIRDGAYVDTLEQMSPTEYLGAGERAGTYAINVQRPGYRVWQRNGIRVHEDVCHVIPVRVNARLQVQ